MSSYTYLYRVRVVAYPEGSHELRSFAWGDELCPVPGWAPPGWTATPEYVARLGTTQFVWPRAGRHYKNRATVARRVALLESFGATAVLDRSNRIMWPDADDSAVAAVS